jgi:tripartite-type tricarboxylate transporter receptor subunit TctC
MFTRRFACRALAYAGAAVVFGIPALSGIAAQAADLSGQRVTLIVPFAEGGGTDTWTRMMAPYLEKYLPGNPKVLVLNKPGGGGITGANYFVEKAKKDGSWIFAQSTSTASNYMLGDPRAKFKLEEFEPVLNSPRGIMQYVRQDLGLHEVKDLKGKIDKMKSIPVEKLAFGGKTPTSGDLALRVALSLLGVEVNSVWGLTGNGPMALGFERGEFTVNYDNTLSFLSNRKHMIDSGMARPLYTFGNYDENGKLTRDPAAPDVPTFTEFYKAVHGKDPSGPGYESWVALMGVSIPLSKSLLLAPGTSKDVVEMWRGAVRKMLADAEFKQKAAKEFGPYPQIVGEAVRPIMKRALSISPEARQWLAKYVKVRYDIELAKK